MAIQEKRAYISPSTGKVNTTNANVGKAKQSGLPSVVTDINGVQTRVYGTPSTLTKLTGKYQGFGKPSSPASAKASGGRPNESFQGNLSGAAAGLTEGLSAATSRLAKAGLPKGAEQQARTETAAKIVPTGTEGQDWRVKLSLPKTYDSRVLAPLARSGNALVFPFTPSIIVQHTAHYNSLQPVHSNYPFLNYENSSVDQLVISGEFFVENSFDAEYWIAAMHYLRSVTKMFYGAGSGAYQGNPPPIVKLNGYGDYVFDNVPVVVQSFMVDMPQDVDYIRAELNSNGEYSYGKGIEGIKDAPDTSASGNAVSWVPTQSTFTVTVQPIYSRSKVEQFNLAKFINGGYINSGEGYL